MDIKLATDGDIDISTGDLVLLTGAEAISQHLKIRFRFMLGEWFIDQRVGIAYFQTILVKGTSLNVVREIFRKVIVTTPGVAKLLSLDLVYAGVTRVLTVTFEANIVGADEPIRFVEELII